MIHHIHSACERARAKGPNIPVIWFDHGWMCCRFWLRLRSVKCPDGEMTGGGNTPAEAYEDWRRSNGLV